LQDLADVVRRLQAERTVQGFELELPGMQERWLEVNAAAVCDREGAQTGAILVFHDLTRIKQLENTRQEFVANVSHELRTPLSLIKGYVETLLEGAKNTPEMATRFLQTIEKHTDRLTYLIEDLLTISRLESGQIVMNVQPVDLREEVDRVVDDLHSRAAEKRVTLQNLLPAELSARADADRLQQVLFNLVENAIKYGREDGHVDIGGRVLPEGRVEMWVKDDGAGVPPEARERIFERFYRVDRARSRETGGTGLGLSIVKHIIQAHGGEVWVKSEVGEGSTFFFTLPQG
jgi:two-component system phosphate regulon sensor histidine kinase PhoR